MLGTDSQDSDRMHILVLSVKLVACITYRKHRVSLMLCNIIMVYPVRAFHRAEPGTELVIYPIRHNWVSGGFPIENTIGSV